MDIKELVQLCGTRARAAGWYKDYDRMLEVISLQDDSGKLAKFFKITYNASRIALIHSEASEALEGVRKGKMDDHLPHLLSEDVELADTVIRIADYCYANGIDLERAILEKLEYNQRRPDHKLENREKDGGKAI
jgi:NTP pyrophosphatase (non-canonical NTP hydrolase)